MKRAILPVVAVAALLAACTRTVIQPPPPTDSTIVSTVTSTRTAQPTYVPPPAATLAPLPPGASPVKGEVEELCPYIRTGLNQDPAAQSNVAEIVGSRVYRTTVITTTKPVGCRFWFYGGENYAEADIVPKTFKTAVDAHNAMVLTAEKTGADAQSRTITVGLVGVVFRTKFYGADGDQDWACAFAKGKVMVVVRTARIDEADSAVALSGAIAGKF